MGEEANDVLASTNISDEDSKKFDSVLSKFDDYFGVRHNVIFERARFNQRDQLAGESVEIYISELYRLAENCKYGDIKDELICDRLVVGISDKKVSQQLQTDPKLTLEKAKVTIRQKAAVQEQGRELAAERKRGESLESLEKTISELQTSLDELRYSKQKQSRRNRGNGRRPGPGSNHKTPGTCSRCGYGEHSSSESCPAANATCHRCGKAGHFSSKCFSKVPAGAMSLDADYAFLDTVDSTAATSWMTTITLEQQKVTFKVDTGAAVTAITEQTYAQLGKPPVSPPTKRLCGPTQYGLDVQGVFIGHFSSGEKTTTGDVYVVKGLKTNLLGLPIITALHLVEKLCCTELKDIEDVKRQFPKVFSGLGTFGEDYEIKLKEDASPFALHAPRSVPIALRAGVKEELNRMEKLGVVRKITEPTEWCAGMVVAPKKTGAMRICVDLKPLNESVKREIYPIPTVDEIMAQLSGSKLFSKLDANSGFWQIPLAKDSQPLTTFVTPHGRYCFNKLPFGISSATEVYQKRMNDILEGLPGVLCLVDDTIIFARTQEEHDQRLRAALQRLSDANVTLNEEKCAFSQRRIHFLGYILDENGIRPDPDKTAAVKNMNTPKSVTELRRFMGMVNHLGKFSPRIATIGEPLRACLSTKNAWTWGPDQDQAFTAIKEELTKPTILALYDPTRETKVSADASSYGLGAVLLQLHGEDWRPITYASQVMSAAERHYAQIEKEALAATWACEKFRTYLLGLDFTIETDHKPLVPLLTTKCLSALPPRIIRFRLRLSHFSYTVIHVPGKFLYTADALSRSMSPTAATEVEDCSMEDFVHSVVTSLPASPNTLDAYRRAQKQDPISRQLLEFCSIGWPAKEKVDPGLRPYWKARDSFTVGDGLLLFNSRIVIPETLRKTVLAKLHQGHQGLERCLQRARCSVWWPGITHHVKQLAQDCAVCAQNARPRRQPLLQTPLPPYPWHTVATDLFELQGVHYLLLVDYFSRYPEIIKLRSTTSTAVIESMKGVFARHGIPELIRSDNGPQYSASEFASFALEYGFQHTTSSPYYPQSNGQAERMVQTAKRLLTGTRDPFTALLAYRATPLPWCHLSPAELLMGRRIRTTVPQTTKHLTPTWPYLDPFRKLNAEYKAKQKAHYDAHFRVRDSSAIPDDTEVWVTTGTSSEPVRGTVVRAAETPRSYRVGVPSGDVRRNRGHIRVVPDTDISSPAPTENSPQAPTAEEAPEPTTPGRHIITRSQTGSSAGRPDYLRY